MRHCFWFVLKSRNKAYNKSFIITWAADASFCIHFEMKSHSWLNQIPVSQRHTNQLPSCGGLSGLMFDTWHLSLTPQWYWDNLCRCMNYWQSAEPLALMISKLDQQRQNRCHKGFKARADYSEQRDLCTTRDFFFFCITVLGVGKKITLTPLPPSIPSSSPSSRDRGITCNCSGLRTGGGGGECAHTHLWERNCVCVCVCVIMKSYF